MREASIILGVTGGIAAYKAADLASKLSQAGAAVHTVMTGSATELVAPLTFQSLTGNPVHVDMFEPPQRWSVEHIALAERAELMVVAPATANVLGKFAAGIADDYLTTLYLAVDCPVVVCPAMNYRMWAHDAVVANVQRLRARGVHVIEPDEGRLASGASGRGRLPPTAAIMEVLEQLLQSTRELAGFRVLVTAGPTHEYLDPVRYLTSPSSGRMGYALAQELARAGAGVVLVTGPTALEPPAGVETVQVVSAAEMQLEVMSRVGQMDAVVKAAAVSDFRPAAAAGSKIKKDQLPLALALQPNPDILLELGQDKGTLVLVGFAAETGDGEVEARRKLRDKNLDLIVLNRVDEPGSGFGVATNRAEVFRADGTHESLPLMDKRQLAARLVAELAELLLSRPGGGGRRGQS